MVQSRQKEIKETVSKAEYDELKKRFDNLQKSLSENGMIGLKQEDDMDEDNEEIVISGDKYIKVMSLTPYLLTLTTQEYGRGKKFNFTAFGEVKRIMYKDLVDIMEQHANFLNDGYFVVLDRNVVRKNGLDDVYSKILTKEKMDKILIGNDSDAVNLFKSCGNVQRRFIINMIHDKMLKDEPVDLNVLDRFSRVVDPTGKYSIASIGEEMKENQNLKSA
jgi:sulfur transfer complex TusBCD TusB component (DsrH family)